MPKRLSIALSKIELCAIAINIKPENQSEVAVKRALLAFSYSTV
jgi:hypothetical protein